MSGTPCPKGTNPSAFALFLQMNRLRFRSVSSDGKPLSRAEAIRVKHAMVFRDEQYESD